MPMPPTVPRRLTCLHCGNEFVAPRRRGQPPLFCSPEHRTAYRTSEQKDRRRIARTLPTAPPKSEARREAEALMARVREAEWARDEQARKEVAEVARAVRAITGPRRIGEEFEATRLPDTWTARDLVPVDEDPAFAWLMEHDPDSAADFPRAHRVGRSSA